MRTRYKPGQRVLITSMHSEWPTWTTGTVIERCRGTDGHWAIASDAHGYRVNRYEREMRPENIDQLAEKIVDRLMTSGDGQKAKRLVLELDLDRDGGGWCRKAAIAQVVEILVEEGR